MNGRRERGSVTVYAIAAGTVLGLIAMAIVQATALIGLARSIEGRQPFCPRREPGVRGRSGRLPGGG